MNLQRLIYLCHLKNELNRKRRRFYYYMNVTGRKLKCKGDHTQPMFYAICKPTTCRGYHWVNYTEPKHISRTEARKGYRQAQSDMKAMTAEMRRMRIEIGARFVWNYGGLIEAIEFDGRRLSQKHFKRFHDSEVFELEFFKS